MSLKNIFNKSVAMSLLTLSIIILLLNFVKSDISKEPHVTTSMQNFKEYMTKVIKEQSSKIQVLLKNVQSNAQSVLRKIRNMNQNQNKLISDGKEKSDAQYQIEAPLIEDIKNNEISTEAGERSFSNHYVSTGFGVSGSSNYVPTYHHHSIGFDPINIVVSMSLLSFLFQALQGFLTRARLPTPVIEAKSLDSSKWVKSLDKKSAFKYGKDDYLKKKILKKYY